MPNADIPPKPTPMYELNYSVSSQEDGSPVRWIALRCLRMSYTQFKHAKFMGTILLDGKPVHADARVRAGQLVKICIPEILSPYTHDPYPIPLTIPYRDDSLLVVDKPAPLPSTSSARQDGYTLENALFAALETPQHFIYRPVNRLDKGASGLMAVALTAHAQQRLQSMLHSDEFTREYLAVCEGSPPERAGVINLPISKDDGASIRRVIDARGKPAKTHYQILRAAQGRSLVQLRLETGRTHQIRVHMQALGCPIAGDFLYGYELTSLPGRFALHCHRMRFTHPLTNAIITVESALPVELAALFEG